MLPARWLAEYRAAWLRGDIVAGVTLAAYAIPVSLAYAGLAGLPPQVGVYGYLLGGLGYALLGSSRQLAIGPTSAISLMIAGTVGAMADGDAQRYAQIASLAGFTVAVLCLIAWLLRLSVLVKLISDSILVGFKAGAGLTIAMTQLPSLFGVAGGGHNFFERAVLFAGQLGQTIPRACHRRRRDRAARARRAPAAGKAGRARRRCAVDRRCLRAWASRAWGADDGRDSGWPARLWKARRCGCAMSRALFRWPPDACCSPISKASLPARTFAAKHGYALDPRQELLGIGAANLAAALGHGYPVAGGLSQSAVNDKAGARTPLALVFASITLALCLLFLTGLLENLPKAVLAAVVLTAVYGLLDFPALLRMWRVSRLDFYAAAIALGRCAASRHPAGHPARGAGLHIDAAGPRVAPACGVPRPHSRHEQLLRPRPSSRKRGPAGRDRLPSRSVADLRQCRRRPGIGPEPASAVVPSDIRLVVCDLSASPYVDLAGSRMLHELHGELAARGIALRIVGARGRVRDLLRADGIGEKVGGLDRAVTLDSLLGP